MRTPVPLKKPNALALSRISDRLSFLYLDRCRIEQDENGTQANVTTQHDETRTVYIPTATLTCLLLGPGTTITQAAVAALGHTGCATTFVGSGGVRSYGTFLSPNTPTKLLEAQARAATDAPLRLEIARKMYLKRFPESLTTAFPDDLSIEALRGMEGIRMRGLYETYARRHRLPQWRRNRDGPDLDPVNEALNYANTALYGIVNGIVLALGMSPGLGIVHSGNRQSFVLDIADLYKADLILPLAFKLWKSTNPGRDIMRELRNEFTLLKLIPRIVDDIHELFDLTQDEEQDWDVNDLYLWGPEGSVIAGNNHAALPHVGGHGTP